MGYQLQDRGIRHCHPLGRQLGPFPGSALSLGQLFLTLRGLVVSVAGELAICFNFGLGGGESCGAGPEPKWVC